MPPRRCMTTAILHIPYSFPHICLVVLCLLFPSPAACAQAQHILRREALPGNTDHYPRSIAVTQDDVVYIHDSYSGYSEDSFMWRSDRRRNPAWSMFSFGLDAGYVVMTPMPDTSLYTAFTEYAGPGSLVFGSLSESGLQVLHSEPRGYLHNWAVQPDGFGSALIGTYAWGSKTQLMLRYNQQTQTFDDTQFGWDAAALWTDCFAAEFEQLPAIARYGDTLVLDWTQTVGDASYGGALFTSVSFDTGRTWSSPAVVARIAWECGDTYDNEPLIYKAYPVFTSTGELMHATIERGLEGYEPYELCLYTADGIRSVIQTQHAELRPWSWKFAIAWGTVPVQQYVLDNPYTSYFEVIGAEPLDLGGRACMTIDRKGEPHFGIRGSPPTYGYLVTPGLAIRGFYLSSGAGSESGGEHTVGARQNALVYLTEWDPPSGDFRAYPVNDGTLDAGEIESLEMLYAGQFSNLGVAHMGTADQDYWDRLRDFRLGEREEKFNAQLEGTFAYNTGAGEQKSVNIELTVDGRAAGRASVLLDDLGGTMRMGVEHALGKAFDASAVGSKIAAELIQQFLAYGVYEAVDWDLDRLLTEWEARADDYANSAFRSSFAGALRIDHDRNGEFTRVIDLHAGFDDWTNTVLPVTLRDPAFNQPLVGVDPGRLISADQDIPFYIDLETLAASSGLSFGAAGVIREIVLTVTDADDPSKTVFSQTWEMTETELYPQTYHDADQHYVLNQSLELMAEGILGGLDFFNRSIVTIGTRMIQDGHDLLTNDAYDLQALVDPNGYFLADESALIGRTASPVFHLQAISIPEGAQELVIEYGLLANQESNAPDTLRFSAWVDGPDGQRDVAGVDFSGVAFTPVEPVEGLPWFSGPLEARLDVSQLDPGMRELVFLLDTADGALYEGAFAIDNVYVSWKRPIKASDAFEEIHPLCEPDLNGDGLVNTQDFIAYLNAWAGGDPIADWDQNGVIDTRDFVAYLNAWAAGC